MMVSVIVPVYKVEKYLRFCIDSILSQTYKNFEIILVDDGSPDKCPSICDEYGAQYDQIRVIHKSNGGLSDARNAGTKMARGEYITYIDSDDFVAPQYLEELVSNLYNDSDCSTVDCRLCYESKIIESSEKSTISQVTGHEALIRMLYQRNMDTHAWGILLKRELALKYPFPVGRYHEDEFTTYQYYINSQMVTISTKRLYYYRQRIGSIMHGNEKALKDEIDAIDQLVDNCERYWPFALKAAHSKQFSDYCQVLLSSDRSNEYIDKKIDELKWDILCDSNCRIKNRLAAFIIIVGGTKLLKKANGLMTKTLNYRN